MNEILFNDTINHVLVFAFFAFTALMCWCVLDEELKNSTGRARDWVSITALTAWFLLMAYITLCFVVGWVYE